MAYNPVLLYHSIYFIKDGTLYKRHLVDETTPTCSAHIQKQSCPASEKNTWPEICKAKDEVLATDITQFSVDYYTSKNENPETNTPIADQYTNPDALADAESVTIQLTKQQPGTAKPLSTSITIRTTKVN